MSEQKTAEAQEREAFEAWALSIGFGPTAFAMQRSDGGYGAMFLESRWEGWQARSALAQAPAPSGEALETLQAIAAVASSTMTALNDGKTDFYIAQSRGLNLSHILRLANAALASPGAMEGAHAAQPLTDRQQRVVTVALFRFASDARSRAEAAAQDKEGRHFKPGDVAAFMRDAEDAEAMLKLDLLRARPPTGEPT